MQHSRHICQSGNANNFAFTTLFLIGDFVERLCDLFINLILFKTTQNFKYFHSDWVFKFTKERSQFIVIFKAYKTYKKLSKNLERDPRWRFIARFVILNFLASQICSDTLRKFTKWRNH